MRKPDKAGACVKGRTFGLRDFLVELGTRTRGNIITVKRYAEKPYGKGKRVTLELDLVPKPEADE